MPKYPSKDLKQQLRQINRDLDEAIQLQDFGKAKALLRRTPGNSPAASGGYS
jgi:hypothetical protein